jgi:selenide,water dikinase
LTAFSHGAGCGCKLSPEELASIIDPLRSHPALVADELVVGFDHADDAGVWKLPSGELLVQTIDFFTPIVDDAYDWGRISAANALSDIYAMGGSPQTALQLVAWPRDGLPFDLLGEVMRGGADVMSEARTTIVGGHSIDDPEPKYGFAVTGLVTDLITNAGAKPGDQLVLTKPLGSGIITTAWKHDGCPPELGREAVGLMITLNDRAVDPMIRNQVHAATDISGFGFLGHLREMLVASNASAVIDPSAIPVLDGVGSLVAAGHFPGGSQRNLKSIRPFVSGAAPDESMMKVLADAQTSGGLLIAVPPAQADDLMAELVDAGYPAASVVGTITAGSPTVSFVSR